MRGVIEVWGRLLRISLAPTAVADVLAGLVLAGGALPGASVTLSLVAASLCVYHGGMALNDWADRKADAETRPERPIPSGRISAGVALGAALLLFAAGILLGWSVSLFAALWIGGIALCAATYDVAGRGAFLGPLLLGVCRAGNLSIGLVALQIDPPLSPWIWCAPLLYGAYVFSLSRLGRHEDGEETGGGWLSPSQWLILMAVLFWSIAVLPIPSATLPGRAVALILGVAASIELLRRSKGLRQWTPPEIIPAMGCALRRMLIFSAALAALPGGLQSFVVIALILALYPVAWYLRGVFPPS